MENFRQVEMAPTPRVNRAAASFLVHGRIGKYVNMLQCLWEILQCQRANHQADVKPSNSVSIFIPVCCVEYNGSSEIPEQQVNKSKSKIWKNLPKRRVNESWLDADLGHYGSKLAALQLHMTSPIASDAVDNDGWWWWCWCGWWHWWWQWWS